MVSRMFVGKFRVSDLRVPSSKRGLTLKRVSFPQFFLHFITARMGKNGWKCAIKIPLGKH